MKDLSNEELINKFRAMCSLLIIYGKFQKEQDFNEANKISDELLSHLAAGEAAVKKLVGLEKEVENLQCCGNCKHYTPRGDCRSKHGYAPGHYCDHWAQDGLTRKDRE